MAKPSDLERSSPLRTSASPRRRLRLALVPARLAAILLLFVWLGPVTFAQTESWQLFRLAGAPSTASANTQLIPAGQALVLEPGTPLRLRLRDGSTVQGRFLGRTLLDSTLYASRFEAYVRTAAYVPFTLGETLRVSLRDGREWSAAFAGYGELALLFRGPDGSSDLRVPFEFAKEIRRASGQRVESKSLARAFQKGQLPSAEALALGERGPVGSVAEQWTSALRVAVQDIESAIVELPSGRSAGGAVVLGVLMGVVLVYVLIAASLHSSSTSCEGPSSFPNVLGGMSLQLTTRPFDRTRGCWDGDPPPVADAWPGERDAIPGALPATPTAIAAPPEAGPAAAGPSRRPETPGTARVRAVPGASLQNTVDRLNW